MPLNTAPMPPNIFFTSCTSPPNIAFTPDTAAFITGNTVSKAFVSPSAMSGGKMFFRLFLKPCAALSQLPANAPVKKLNSASNTCSPLSTAVTMPSKAATVPPTSVSSMPPASAVPAFISPANSFLNIPATALQKPPIFPAMLPIVFPIDVNFLLNPSTENPAFSNAFLNQLPTPCKKPLTLSQFFIIRNAANAIAASTPITIPAGLVITPMMPPKFAIVFVIVPNIRCAVPTAVTTFPKTITTGPIAAAIAANFTIALTCPSLKLFSLSPTLPIIPATLSNAGVNAAPNCISEFFILLNDMFIRSVGVNIFSYAVCVIPAASPICPNTLVKSADPFPASTVTLFNASVDPNSFAIVSAFPPVFSFISSRNLAQPTLCRCADEKSNPSCCAVLLASAEGFRILLYAAFNPVTASLVAIPFFVSTAILPNNSSVDTLRLDAIGITFPMLLAISPKDVLPKFCASSI